MPASLWDEARTPLDSEVLEGDSEFDVVIIGAGYTGLWTALELVESEPSLRIAIVEKETVGFGASGRNGGWCSAILPLSLDRVAARHGVETAVEMQTLMFEVVDDIGSTTKQLGIDCDYVKGGTISLIRDRFQKTRADEAISQYRRFGFGNEHLERLDSSRTRNVVRVQHEPESNFQPDCAAIHPRKLVDGLASAVSRLGVRIFESTPATTIQPGCVTTDRGRIGATSILICTEGYSANLPDRRRDLLPLYSLMICTEPLSSSQWQEIGLADRTTFADFRHLLIYGQRTADDRLAFGGRGAPYHFGSRIKPEYDADRTVKEHLARELRTLFPSLDSVEITHHWGGPLGVPRDWSFSVRFDPSSGIGGAGGYVGDGVATSRLAALTLADLVLSRTTRRTALPFAGHRSKRWEPEPLRWSAVNSLTKAAARMDRSESRGRPPSRVVSFAINRFTGG